MVIKGNHPQMALIQVSEKYYNLPRSLELVTCFLLTQMLMIVDGLTTHFQKPFLGCS